MLDFHMVDHIQIVEVSPRDGLQADPADLSTQQKIQLVERLVAAGHTRVEAASFVSPMAVPKMADGDEVMAGVPRVAGVSYSALAFNIRGVERAIAAGVDEVNGVVVASETFSQKNQNASVAESIDKWRQVSEAAKAAGMKTSVVIPHRSAARSRGEYLRLQWPISQLRSPRPNQTSWHWRTRSVWRFPTRWLRCLGWLATRLAL